MVGLCLEMRMELRQDVFPPSLGIDGTPKNLKSVLRRVPQFDKENNRINYLISGGWACEILSGRERKHKDIDILILNTDLYYEDTDNMEPENYFGIISTTADVIKKNHISKKYWMLGRKNIYVPSVEFLIASKLAPYKGKPARSKDLEDVVDLLQTRSKINFKNLVSAFSIVNGLDDPIRYATVLYKLHECKNQNYEGLVCAVYQVSKYLTNYLSGKKND